MIMTVLLVRTRKLAVIVQFFVNLIVVVVWICPVMKIVQPVMTQLPVLIVQSKVIVM